MTMIYVGICTDVKAYGMDMVWAEFVTTSIDSLSISKFTNSECIGGHCAEVGNYIQYDDSSKCV